MKTTRVNYNGLTADITPDNLKSALQVLCELSPEAKKARMELTIRSLEDAIQHMDDVPQTENQTVANDLGIWFANEVIEGRSEKFKVMISHEIT